MQDLTEQKDSLVCIMKFLVLLEYHIFQRSRSLRQIKQNTWARNFHNIQKNNMSLYMETLY